MTGSRRSSTSSPSQEFQRSPELHRQLSEQAHSARSLKAFSLAIAAFTRLSDRHSISRINPSSRIILRFPELDNSSSDFLPVVRRHANEKLVFLAGGLTAPVDAPVDWRASILQRLVGAAHSGFPDAALMCPCFEAKKMGLSKHLRQWEMQQFAKSDVVLFWFHKYTPCTPNFKISLLEFGMWAVPQAHRANGKYKVIVGADPEYVERRTLARHCDGKYELHDSLESLGQAAVDALRKL